MLPVFLVFQYRKGSGDPRFLTKVVLEHRLKTEVFPVFRPIPAFQNAEHPEHRMQSAVCQQAIQSKARKCLGSWQLEHREPREHRQET